VERRSKRTSLFPTLPLGIHRTDMAATRDQKAEKHISPQADAYRDDENGGPVPRVTTEGMIQLPYFYSMLYPSATYANVLLNKVDIPSTRRR
jgi:hypothetical protein